MAVATTAKNQIKLTHKFLERWQTFVQSICNLQFCVFNIAFMDVVRQLNLSDIVLCNRFFLLLLQNTDVHLSWRDVDSNKVSDTNLSRYSILYNGYETQYKALPQSMERDSEHRQCAWTRTDSKFIKCPVACGLNNDQRRENCSDYFPEYRRKMSEDYYCIVALDRIVDYIANLLQW